MIDKAIAKITQEAMAINDPIAFAIEEHLTEKCTSDAAALLILADDKSLKKIYDNIWSEAKKRRKGNCAYIPPEEVYDMVDKYYGLEQLGTKAPKREPASRVDILDLI
ncbi:MAG: PcfK-like family protein [Mogibacterium sp.]|nr:PcfK-like family protein [Mogibacterium sp.]